MIAYASSRARNGGLVVCLGAGLAACAQTFAMPFKRRPLLRQGNPPYGSRDELECLRQSGRVPSVENVSVAIFAVTQR